MVSFCALRNLPPSWTSHDCGGALLAGNGALSSLAMCPPSISRFPASPGLAHGLKRPYEALCDQLSDPAPVNVGVSVTRTSYSVFVFVQIHATAIQDVNPCSLEGSCPLHGSGPQSRRAAGPDTPQARRQAQCQAQQQRRIASHPELVAARHDGKLGDDGAAPRKEKKRGPFIDCAARRAVPRLARHSCPTSAGATRADQTWRRPAGMAGERTGCARDDGLEHLAAGQAQSCGVCKHGTIVHWPRRRRRRRRLRASSLDARRRRNGALARPGSRGSR